MERYKLDHVTVTEGFAFYVVHVNEHYRGIF